MNNFRSMLTHLLVAIVGGGVALVGYLQWHPALPVAESVTARPITAPVLPPAATPEVKELQKTSRAFVAIAKAAQPAVVNIGTVQVIKSHGRGMMPGMGPQEQNPLDEFFGDDFLRRFFGGPGGGGGPAPEQKRQGLGSGMIVDAEKGYILTNNHVVADADEIKVTLADGRSFDAKVVGTDTHTDVGVVQIKNPPKDLAAVKLGDSDSIDIGDWAIAVGNPFGLNQTVTVGIISAKGRANVNVVDYEDFIQTDAAINPGNSGGPLLNVNGEVIGVNTAIFSRSGGYQGIGFSIPSNMAKIVMEKLISGGKIERGFLGVYLQDISDQLAKNFGLSGTEGALVSQVMPDAPAAKAGLKDGDVIVTYDGKKVVAAAELRSWVAFTAVGKTVDLGVIRDGKEITLKLTIGARPDTEQQAKKESKELSKLGISVAELTDELRGKYHVESKVGVIITEIAPDGIIAELGLLIGDVILEMNRQKIQSVEDFKSAAGKLDDKQNLLMLIERQGRRMYVALNK